MRSKAVPRRRKRNSSHESTKPGQEQTRSAYFTRQANKEFVNIEEYNRVSETFQKPESKSCEVPGTSGDSHPVNLVTGRYVGEAGLLRDVNGSVMESYGAVNLCTRNSYATDIKTERKSELPGKEGITRRSDKFVGSLLYQIMTDPTFVENIKNNKEIKKLTCEFCKKQFANYDELQNHLDSAVNKSNRVTCCACGKTFGQKRYLRYHQRCHIMNNKFTCEICTRKYSRMDNLTRHKAYHTNPDKYPCKICKKTFSRRDLMTKHLKSHEGKRNSCDICKQVFTDFEKMKSHRLAFHTPSNGT